MVTKKESKNIKESKKVIELTEMLKRIQAEFENYRKRKEKEIQQITKYSNKELISKLLNTIDNLELALESKDNNNLRKGIEMVYSQLLSTLQKEGLEKIKENKRFNPEIHEAILSEDSNQENGTILEVFQQGYKLKGNVLRASKVKVAKNNVNK